MSSEQQLAEIEPEELSNGQIIECIRGMQARIQHLEKENDELRETLSRIDDNSVTKTAMNHVLSSILNHDIQDFSTDIFQHKDAAEDFNDRISSIENTVKRHESVIEEEGTATGDTKEQAWKSVVKMAENLSSHQDHALPDDRVLLYSKQIETATGYSNRRACQLIEEWGEEKEGAYWRPYKRRDNDIQKKALKVDLNVWSDQDE